MIVDVLERLEQRVLTEVKTPLHFIRSRLVFACVVVVC